MNKLTRLVRSCRFILPLVLLVPAISGFAETGRIKTITLVPFEINSQADIFYISSGILNMFDSRLSWQGHVKVIKTLAPATSFPGTEQPAKNRMLMEIGEKTTADYVITGSITEFSGAYSIDTQVYNLEEKSYLTFYGQSKTIDKVIPAVDIIAAKINKKILNRTTSSYEKFKKEKIITEEQLRRMNPERMMPTLPQDSVREKPWWKIW